VNRPSVSQDTKRELGPYPLVIVIAIGVVAVLSGIWIGGWAAALVTVGFALVLIAGIVAWSALRRDALDDAPPPAAPADGTRRVLVVVDERWAESSLISELKSRADGRPLSAFVVAPALESRVGRITDDQAGYDEATGRLGEVLERLEAAAIPARGEVGAADPLQAADDGLRQFPADEIVFVTHPQSDANWLEAGVVDKAKSRFTQPVEQIQALA
jgi:hypothetical protein